MKTTIINTNDSENESFRELTTSEMADMTGGLGIFATITNKLDEAARVGMVFDALFR